MTSENHEADRIHSRQIETSTQIKAMRDLYSTAFEFNAEIYDSAFKLTQGGYCASTVSGIIQKSTDIATGTFTKELKAKGRTKQKADVVVRRKSDDRLTLIEAKAAGVEIDTTKRIKECCDKVGDWCQKANKDQ